MPQILYPAAEEVRGPWWLDRKALEELDAVFENDHKASKASGEPPQRSVEVTFDDGGLAKADSFRGLLRDHSERSKQVPVAFVALYKVGDLLARVEVCSFAKGKNPLRAADDDGGPSLVIQVVPESDDHSRQLFGDLRLWARRSAAPRVHLAFERYGGWLVVPVIVAFFALMPPDAPNATAYHKAEARRLLASVDGGMVDPNKALPLLLAIVADAPAATTSPSPEQPIPKALLALEIIMALAVVYVARSPGVLLGIGRGENRIESWLRLRKLFVLTVPAFVFAWYVEPVARRFLHL
jgi:hypothetical protein